MPCDTFLCLGTGENGETIFAKNSDRDPNEAHEVVCLPRKEHDTGDQLVCTYTTIDQALLTHAVLLAKPQWMWGAEMGVNEHNVAIGNEAIFTKCTVYRGPGRLTGMDLVRLGLERAATAQEALGVITTLLERYGQGGNCGCPGRRELYYHNSFLIVDPNEAWLLETADVHWVARRVPNGSNFSISNVPAIGHTYDLMSADMIGFAARRGWYQGGNFSFKDVYADQAMVAVTRGDIRSCRTLSLLDARHRHTLHSVFAVTRDHGYTQEEEEQFYPSDPTLGNTLVCMHSANMTTRRSQTTASMVCVFAADRPGQCWVTGTAAACLSVYKPLWTDTLHSHWAQITRALNGVWDEGESLHRRALGCYRRARALVASDQSKLEAEFASEMDLLGQNGVDAEHRALASLDAISGARARTRVWASEVGKLRSERTGFGYARWWNSNNGGLGVEVRLLEVSLSEAVVVVGVAVVAVFAWNRWRAK